MSSATQPLGLRFTFSRDLVYKFTRDNIPVASESEQRWRVAGTFDILEISKFDSLDELGVDPPTDELRTLNSYGDLIVFPIDATQHDGIAALVGPGELRPPLLVCTTITLSPAMYERGANYTAVLDAIKKFHSYLQTRITNMNGFPPTYFYSSLGSPDLVFTSYPTTPIQLVALGRFIEEVRTLGVDDAFRERISVGAGRPGHACSVVEPLLAFRISGKSQFETPEFRLSEAEEGVGLRFSMRVDCGHEATIVNDLTRFCPAIEFDLDESAPRIAWGPFTLSGRFRHLADFIKVLEHRWLRPDWRESNLVETESVYTTRSVSHVRPADSRDFPKAWRLTEEVSNELKQIYQRLSTFGALFLGHSQNAELLGIFRSFESCFYRFEFLGAARDLYPFFRQLAAMFSQQEFWRKYLNTGTTQGDASRRGLERFDSQMQTLLAHLSRAVRNRMDHRTVDANPFLLTTLEHGACKLVSAYTVVFWFCSELFRRESHHERESTCDANYFAACLAAGAEGRVMCQEIFRNFREHVEAETKQSLGCRVAGEWTARLLLLDISGKSLLRPELCVVHCMHEVAELSEWIELPRTEDLRVAVNRWILRECVATIESIVGRDSDGSNEVMFLAAITAFALPDSRIESEADMRVAIEQIEHSFPPERLMTKVLRMIARAIDIDVEPTIRAIGRSDAAPFPDFIKRVNGEERLTCALYPLLHLVPEIVADIGMWCALDTLLTSAGCTRNAEVRIADLCRIYESLLLAVNESRGPERSKTRIHKLILHRWAFQLAMFLEPSAITTRIVERLRKTRATCPHLPSDVVANGMLQESFELDLQFSRTEGLAGQLRQFAAYGGGEKLGFPGIEVFPQGVDELIRIFVKAWQSAGNDQDRRDLALHLWAKSQRLSFDRVLDQVT